MHFLILVFNSFSTNFLILRAPIDEGDNRAVVINNEITASDGLAVDWIYNHIYWADSLKNTIELSNVDGNMRKTLIKTALDLPRAIAVNPLQGCENLRFFIFTIYISAFWFLNA